MTAKLIAMGNTLMKDDAIGIELARLIEKNLIERNIEVVYVETDVQYGISKVKEEDYIFILDAGHYGKSIGEITTLSLNNFTSNKKISSGHSYNFLDLLKIYYSNIQGEIFAIEVKEVDFGIGLSNLLQEKLKNISEEILIRIDKNINLRR
jgi:hydrogenase maturation protease